MTQTPSDSWQENLHQIAVTLPYPPTPDFSGHGRSPRLPVQHRQLRPIMAAILIILVTLTALLGIPTVRAALLEFLQIGAIRIQLVEPSPTPTPAANRVNAATPVSTPQPSPTPFDLASLRELDGEITYEEAVKRAGFTVRLPAYPEDLGEPDHVYLQYVGGTMLVLVWMDPQSPEKIDLALFEIGPGSWAGEKGAPYFYEHTTVGTTEALWAEGPYPLVLTSGDIAIRRVVAGKALIWAVGEITYRLECSLTLDEARKIAKSLMP